jgi:hexosaminidase
MPLVGEVMKENKRRLLLTILAVSLGCNLFVAFYGAHKAAWKVRQLARERKSIEAQAGHQSTQPETVSYYLGRDQVFKTLPNDSNSIIFLGNSLTQMFELSELFRDLRIKNRGIMGDISRGALRRLAEITNRKPAKIFIEIGINDLLNGYPFDSIEQNYKDIVGRIKKDSPGTKIYLQSLFPTNKRPANQALPLPSAIRALNRFLHDVAAKQRITYIDLYSPFSRNDSLNPTYDCGDGVHFSGEGYREWRDLVKRYVDE